LKKEKNMKRYNLIQARGGDFAGCFDAGADVEGEGNDVMELQVVGGTVSVIVPADLPDGEVCEECWFNNHTCLDIELEDGTRITGWVRGGEVHLDAEFPARRKTTEAA
jgi:hypothetical protein